MKHLFILLLLALSGQLCLGQAAPRGAIAEVSQQGHGKIRAVVVGVSRYKNLTNPLKYADDDAELIANYFTKLPQTDSLILLLNEDATAARFQASLIAMIKKSKEGDAIYVYFAGHGNVQQEIEEGFLLFTNVTPKDTDYFGDDTIMLSDLKKYGTLCGKRKIKFILITDACRSGSIFDNEKGQEQTLATLGSDWDYTVKLVSCQSNESSFEYPELGNGHGAFTYYLVEGLAGKAEDFEKNQIIELGELREFVDQPVRKKTENRQHPAWTNNAKFPIAPRVEMQMEALAKNDLAASKSKGDVRNSGSNDKESRNGRAQALGKTIEKGKLIRWKEKKEVKVAKSKVTSAYPKVETNTGNIALDPLRKKIVILHHKNPTIKFFDIDENGLQPNGTITASGSFVTFAPDGKNVVVATWAGEIILFDSENKTKAKSQTIGTSAKSIEFNHAGNSFAAIGSNGKIQIVSFPNLQLGTTLQLENVNVTSVKFSPDDGFLYAASKNKNVYAIDLSTNLWNLIGKHSAAVNTLALSPNGQFLYAGDEAGNIVKWDVAKKLKVSATKPSGNVVNFHDLSLSDDGSFLLALGKQYSMTLLSTDALQTVNQFTVTKSGITKAILDQAAQKIYAVTYAGDLVQVDVELNSLDAVTMFQSIRANKSLSPQLIAKFQTDIVAELLTAGQHISKPFIAGESVLPGVDSIEYGIRVLESAIEISDHSEVIKQEAESKILFLKGMKIIQANELEKMGEAISLFNQLLQKEPRATYPHNALALAFKKQNELEKAKSKLKEASKQIDTWTEPLANLGIIALAARNYPEATSYFQKIVQLESTLAKGYRLLGECEMAQGNYVKAVNYLTTAQTKDSSDPLISCQLAKVEFLRRNFSKSEAMLNEVIKSHPSFSVAYHYLATLYLHYYLNYERSTKTLFKAYNNAKIALAANPNDPDNLYLLSKIVATSANYLSKDQLSEIDVNLIQADQDWRKATYKQALSFVDSAARKNKFNWQYVALQALITKETENESRGIAKITQNGFLNSNEKNFSTALFYAETNQLKKAEPYFTKSIDSRVYPQDFVEPLLFYVSKLPSFDPAKWENMKYENSPTYWCARSQAIAKEKVSSLTKAMAIDPDYLPARILSNTMNLKKWQAEPIMGSTIEGIPLNNLLSISTTSGGKYLTNGFGEILSELPYETVVALSENLLKVSNATKWGVITLRGDTIIHFEYDQINLERNLLVAYREGLQGLYSIVSNKWILQAKAEEVKFSESFIGVKLSGKWGAIDYSGRLIVPYRYEEVEEANKLLRKEIKAKSKFVDHYYTLDGKCIYCN